MKSTMQLADPKTIYPKQHLPLRTVGNSSTTASSINSRRRDSPTAATKANGPALPLRGLQASKLPLAPNLAIKAPADFKTSTATLHNIGPSHEYLPNFRNQWYRNRSNVPIGPRAFPYQEFSPMHATVRAGEGPRGGSRGGPAESRERRPAAGEGSPQDDHGNGRGGLWQHRPQLGPGPHRRAARRGAEHLAVPQVRVLGVPPANRACLPA